MLLLMFIISVFSAFAGMWSFFVFINAEYGDPIRMIGFALLSIILFMVAIMVGVLGIFFKVGGL